MRLQTRITIMIVIIVLLSASVTMALTTAALLHSTDRALERNLFNIAETVAKLPVVLEELKGPPVNGEIQRQVQDILESSLDVDLIVVCNMRRQRYAHPNPDRIGGTLVGNDESRVLESASRYISTATGTLGTSIRAFVPVFDGDRQLGFIVAGTLVHRVEKAHWQMALSLLIYLFSGLGIGLVGAMVLARRVKGILLGLEPEEIARLYSEHSGLLEALHEGVIAIDAQGRISMVNESARAMLDTRERLAGVEVDSVLPNCRLPEVMSTGQAEYDKEQEMLGRQVIINRVPIYDKGRIVGAVATFRDKTLLVRLAEELTGAKQLVAALRASSHEFLNKLQVLLGLLDLGKHDQAKKYILDSHRGQLETNKELMSTFRDPIIAGLMFGKASFCREQNVRLVVAPDSRIDVIDDANVTHALVTVIGNLIDNAVESARDVPNGGGKITVSLKNDAERVTAEVRDNGAGLDVRVRDGLFTRGVSTKGDGRGLGLFLVRQDLAAVGGTIRVESEKGETVFRAVIPLVRRDGEAGK